MSQNLVTSSHFIRIAGSTVWITGISEPHLARLIQINLERYGFRVEAVTLETLLDMIGRAKRFDIILYGDGLRGQDADKLLTELDDSECASLYRMRIDEHESCLPFDPSFFPIIFDELLAGRGSESGLHNLGGGVHLIRRTMR